MIAQTTPSAAEVLTQMTQAIAELKDVHIEVSGIMYTIEPDGSAQSSFSAEVIKAGSHYYSRFMGTEIFVDDTLMLTIDNESRIMIADPFDPAIMQQSGLGQLDWGALTQQYQNWIDSTQLQLTPSAEGYILEIPQPGALINLVRVKIHKKTYLPTQFEYRYNEKLKSSISKVIADYAFKPLKSNYMCTAFKREGYIRKTGNTYVPSSRYGSYRYVNRLF